jgi:hypothetical protein
LNLIKEIALEGNLEKMTEGLTGGGGINEAISCKGIDVVVPLSKGTVYESLLGGLLGDVAGKGMSILVPDRRVLVEGMTRSIRVPGDYFFFMWGFLLQRR